MDKILHTIPGLKASYAVTVLKIESPLYLNLSFPKVTEINNY